VLIRRRGALPLVTTPVASAPPLLGGTGAGILQTPFQDFFSGRKIRRNSQDNLTCAKRGVARGLYAPGGLSLRTLTFGMSNCEQTKNRQKAKSEEA